MIFRNILLLIVCCSLWAACSRPKNDIHQEAHRPKFHFTPPQMWMNDPNGMVYYQGEYHLFYQHYPDSTVWGPMHWGHAVSKDLTHWEHLPIALYPDSIGLIFSGSVVVDENNTTGFQKGEEKPLVAIFTYHNMAGEKAGKIDFQTQGMAYSLDKGRTWTKYANNPIIKNPNIKDFRDPKVMWHAASKQWVMTLAVADHVAFYTSKDLKTWAKTGEFGKTEGAHGGVWECPDLFPIKVEGSNNEKWVLIQSLGNGAPNGGSGTQYFIGQFDGKTFKNDNAPETILWLDYGRDNYAGVTWSNAPDGRRLFLGWMSNWQYATKVPTVTWRSAMTLPRELQLKNTEKGVRLFQMPVKEQQKLRGNTVQIPSQNIAKSLDLEAKANGAELDLTFDLTQTTAQAVNVVLSNKKGEKVTIGYEKSSNRFYIDRTKSGKIDFESGFAGRHYAPRNSSDKLLKMKIYVDVASVELFADDGATAMTDVFFPNEDFSQITLQTEQGTAFLKAGEIFGY
jgi:fructan beta-fructosidase